jgi:endonuclease YncB( thermonuclease family)
MNQDDILAAHYFEGGLYIKISDHLQAVRSAVAVDRENVAKWMVERGYATGHGDTVEDLLKELQWQVAEREREECAKIANAWQTDVLNPQYNCDCATAIRRRGEK